MDPICSSVEARGDPELAFGDRRTQLHREDADQDQPHRRSPRGAPVPVDAALGLGAEIGDLRVAPTSCGGLAGAPVARTLDDFRDGLRVASVEW
jgi:hypothetical protein